MPLLAHQSSSLPLTSLPFSPPLRPPSPLLPSKPHFLLLLLLLFLLPLLPLQFPGPLRAPRAEE